MLYCVARAEHSDKNYIGSGALYQLSNISSYSIEAARKSQANTNIDQDFGGDSRAFGLSRTRIPNPIRDSVHCELQKSIVRELIFMFQGVKSNFFAYD
jgi:hypothetical protein